MITIAVEGIISAGKSTLLKKCLIPILIERGWKVTLVDEPVEKWCEDELLKLFYEDPKRYAYHFQTKAFHDRVKECQKQYETHKSDTDVFLLERSVFSDTIFMNTLHHQGMVSDMELRHYNEWWSLWEKVVPIKPDLFIYLKPNLEVCMERLKERSRDGEEGVDVEYQSLLQSFHDKFFDVDAVEVAPGHYVPVMKIETNSNFRDDPEVKRDITNQIEAQLKKIQHSKSERNRS